MKLTYITMAIVLFFFMCTEVNIESKIKNDYIKMLGVKKNSINEISIIASDDERKHQIIKVNNIGFSPQIPQVYLVFYNNGKYSELNPSNSKDSLLILFNNICKLFPNVKFEDKVKVLVQVQWAIKISNGVKFRSIKADRGVGYVNSNNDSIFIAKENNNYIISHFVDNEKILD